MKMANVHQFRLFKYFTFLFLLDLNNLFLLRVDAFSCVHLTRFHNPVINRWKESTHLHGKWDNLVDEDDDDYDEFESQGPEVPKDMRYVEFNIVRQNKNFVAIREAGGPEMTNDIYVRETDSSVFWFVGKVARISDVPIEKAVAKQYPLIEEHAARLRPMELYPKRGSLEIWTTSGDSEMDVAYNRPNTKFSKIKRDEQADKVRNVEIGFQGEIYDSGEEGFRTLRTEDGLAMKDEIVEPDGEKRPPTDDEMEKINEMLKGQDLNALFKETE
mmetsp:Transcript_25665/g.29787  ORF Transcript_25665/g.29787 Transcript_25665/m.29787 type:complete len:272 (-) Transcript_25665:492-1307(-)